MSEVVEGALILGWWWLIVDHTNETWRSVCRRTMNNFIARKINRWLVENMRILTYLTGMS